MIFGLLSGQIGIISFIIWILSLISAVTVHEFAHAAAAWKLGDPTAKLSGRLTLNPKAHLDPLGTFLLLLTGFGWGRPVPVNVTSFEDPLKDYALTSLAGPASNLLLAFLLSFLGRLTGSTLVLAPLIVMNINLGVFNLLPIAPLDGYRVVSGALPQKLAAGWENLSNLGPIFLLLLLLPIGGGSPLEAVLSPTLNFFINLLLR